MTGSLGYAGAMADPVRSSAVSRASNEGGTRAAGLLDADGVRSLPEEYRSIRRAGFDYDPPPIPPSEVWPAQ